MKLEVGFMKSKDVATWMGIKYDTYRRKTEQRLQILESYCRFERIHGGINIFEVFVDTYQGDLMTQDVKNYLEEIQSKEVKLSSVAGMARKFSKEKEEYKELKESAVIYRLTKAGKLAFGRAGTKEVPKEPGLYGSRELVWAIKVDHYNTYRYMTLQEMNKFNDIISETYSYNQEKIKEAAALEHEFRTTDMSKETYFFLKDSRGLDLFGACVKKFNEETGESIVRCSLHEITMLPEEAPWEEESL